MPHRINIVLDDSVRAQLQEIPQGERSKIINESLAETLARRGRMEAFARIRERSKSLEPLEMSAEEWSRRDRDNHANVLMTMGPGEPLSAPEWQRQIPALTTRHRVTFYDAAHHALAIVNEGIFVTADEKYLKTVGDDKHAVHLKDWR
ncbi:hypothetical protein sS8_4538 [Methylocaldum marinum]|uniref:PIN domain-containing protein n=1 Tax=Methylocaldum marinum TaxID=1432792 RepID=A0A250KXR9_9GAMM|nr:hypothetical protein [Methylocaldum marinum]BBA36468.1 hypothetical protein sS8_4538 [Methylocaldum marinum]